LVIRYLICWYLDCLLFDPGGTLVKLNEFVGSRFLIRGEFLSSHRAKHNIPESLTAVVVVCPIMPEPKRLDRRISLEDVKIG
jgi:hypothetical protein